MFINQFSTKIKSNSICVFLGLKCLATRNTQEWGVITTKIPPDKVNNKVTIVNQITAKMGLLLALTLLILKTKMNKNQCEITQIHWRIFCPLPKESCNFWNVQQMHHTRMTDYYERDYTLIWKFSYSFHLIEYIRKSCSGIRVRLNTSKQVF